MSADTEVLVCGAGPVGMLVGILLGQAGIRTMVVDRRTRIPERSMAIGITPPSLGILDRMDLAETVRRQAMHVHQVVLEDGRRRLGTLRLDGLRGPHPTICTLPQAATMQLLQERLLHQDHVHLRLDTELVAAQMNPQGLDVQLRDASGAYTCRAGSLVGCDGAHSRVRRLLDTRMQERDHGQDFLMADFPEGHGTPGEARLVFSPQGSVEAFPLPAGQRRWIVQCRPEERDAGALTRHVQERCGVALDPATARDPSHFHPRRRIAHHFSRGHVALAGDAAHVITPIGGQGMNLGLADAEFLAAALQAVHRGALDHATAFCRYAEHRRPACLAAARRAEAGMWLGTRTGRMATRLRNLLLEHLLLRPPLSTRLPAWAAMQTLPHRRFHPAMLKA